MKVYSLGLVLSIAQTKRHSSTKAVASHTEVIKMALTSPFHLHHILWFVRHIILGKNIVKRHTILLPSLGTWARAGTRSAIIVVKNQVLGSSDWTSFLHVISDINAISPATACKTLPPNWDISWVPVFTSPTRREVHSFLDSLKYLF